VAGFLLFNDKEVIKIANDILETYKNRPVLTITKIIAIIMGLVTQLYYQEITVQTLTEAFDKISDKNLLWTWGLNLLSVALLVGTGFSWIKEAIFYRNYFDLSPEISRVTCAVTGLVCFLYSFVFFNFIFSKLLGLVIVVAIVAIFLFSGSGGKGKGR
jgi:uncharacterized membrane protein